MSQNAPNKADLNIALAALRRDLGQLGARLRTLRHDVSPPHARFGLRLHYPALRDAVATVSDLIDVIKIYIPGFCLPRAELEKIYARKDHLDAFTLHTELTALNARALNTFIRAQAATDRSGEAGELLLYLLNEWILEAPQVVAKMSLKTSRDMHVFGSDGIHAKFVPETRQLIIYTGEAKLHADIGGAIRSAVGSIGKSLAPDKIKHELNLVRRDLSLSGLPAGAREALLGYLNPMNENSNLRIDAIACLIGFDFAGYTRLGGAEDAEQIFCSLAQDELRRASLHFAQAMAGAGLQDRMVELFLLPLPSVADFRILFSESIGQRLN